MDIGLHFSWVHSMEWTCGVMVTPVFSALSKQNLLQIFRPHLYVTLSNLVDTEEACDLSLRGRTWVLFATGFQS